MSSSKNWFECPKCGFRQVPGLNCLKCGLVFEKWKGPEVRVTRPGPAAQAPTPKGRAGVRLLAGLGLLFGGALVTILLVRKPFGTSPTVPSATPSPKASEPASPALSLAGVWSGEARGTMPGEEPSAYVKTVTLESDTDGKIVAASLLYRVPGSGVVGAGYRLSPPERELLQFLSQIDERGEIESFAPAFVPLPSEWGPASRNWRSLEGYWKQRPHGRRKGIAFPPEEVRYLILESNEGGHLCQIGATRPGVLSYAFWSAGLAPPGAAGREQLSAVVAPSSDRLGSFSRILWDLSGRANFEQMRITAAVTGPGGTRDTIILSKR